MRTIFAAVWTILVCTLFLQIGNGLQTDIIGLRADMAFSSAVVGLIMGAYFIGYCAGPLTGHAIIARIGYRRLLVACAVLAAGAVCALPFVITVPVWMVLRILLGLAISLCYVVIESWIHGMVSNAQRGRVLAVYVCIQIIGMTLAQILLRGIGVAHILPFAVTALCFLAIVPLFLLSRHSGPPNVPQRPLGLVRLFRFSPYGTFATALAGLTWTILACFGPVYAQHVGFDVAGVSLFMTVAMLAGGIVQLPAGWLSDLIGRRVVIALLLGIATLAGILGACTENRALILVAVAAAGAGVFPIYAVATAYVNDSIPQNQRVGAAAGLVLLFGLGSLLGPVLCGWAMARFGGAAFFALMAAVSMVGFVISAAGLRLGRTGYSDGLKPGAGDA